MNAGSMFCFSDKLFLAKGVPRINKVSYPILNFISAKNLEYMIHINTNTAKLEKEKSDHFNDISSKENTDRPKVNLQQYCSV